MKKCKECHETKPFSDFYKLSKARQHLGDGHNAICKDCIKRKRKSPEAREKARIAWKIRYATPEGKKANRDKCRRYRQTETGKIGHKQRNQKYRRTEKGRMVARESCANYRQTANFKRAIQSYRDKFPERRAAQIKLMNALKCGRIDRPINCSVCSKHCIPEGHHPNYDKPLKVIWLCKQCHVDFHRGRLKP